MVSFLWPKTWLLYTASAVLGAGAAITWTGQGTYLSKCSDPNTISRNSGLFWAMLQASMFFGNLFVYFQFQGQTHIQEGTRQLVFSVLIAVAVLGLLFLAVLKNPKHFEVVITDDNNDADSEDQQSVMANVVHEFKAALKLFTTRDMMLLSLTFLYTGERGVVTFILNQPMEFINLSVYRYKAVQWPLVKPVILLSANAYSIKPKLFNSNN